MSKDFPEAIEALGKRGGKYQRAASSIWEVVGKFSVKGKFEMKLDDLFAGVPRTKWGENRIKKCVKYDLTGFCRCLAIQDNGVVLLAYVGTHDQCQKWLDRHRGCTLAYAEGELEIIHSPEIVDGPRPIAVDSDPKMTAGSLLDKLKGQYADIIADSVSGRQYMAMKDLRWSCSDDDILSVLNDQGEDRVQSMIMEVLTLLRDDDIDAAKNHLLYFRDELKSLDEVDVSTTEIKSNENVLFLDELSTMDLAGFFEKSWKDWMLFMHPGQKEVVDREFSGPARLLGVSGSGKTCVLVNRAIRLAGDYPKERILLTTINQALAALIKELVREAVDLQQDKEDLLDRIEVKSFWDVTRDLILEHEKDPLIRMSLDQYTEMVGEDVDEIWSEYYRRENNNDDAKVLEPVHKALIGRKVHPMRYIKDEFDFIRSAVPASDRAAYLELERKGRQVMLQKEQRQLLLEALEMWEEKMEAVGVSDYLGMLKYLAPYEDKVKAKYRCVLVDELQDFGTSELRLVRRLVEKNENDIFMCGDVAQVVHVKQHKPREAGIEVAPRNYLTITKNYRNSRQILEAASAVFTANTSEEYREQHDGELLQPEMANFSSPRPFIRQSNSLEMELVNALAYLDDTLDDGEIGCVAIAGMSFFEVEDLGKVTRVPVLDGQKTTISDRIFLSDLEQTKGFEFDRVVVANLTAGVFPNPLLPEEEVFRDVSKLYVSMTRAKKELTISYCGTLSPMFEDCLHVFSTDSPWEDHVEDEGRRKWNVELAEVASNSKMRAMTGFAYSCTTQVVGLGAESCDRLIERVAGTKAIGPDGVPYEWTNVGEFTDSLSNSRIRPQLNRILGQGRFKELDEHFRSVGLLR